MLTRLKVRGFKNLIDADLRFGPFTCVAGANGVGKSNLLDAIAFLSSLADKPLVEAALSVRADSSRFGDAGTIFTQHGDWRAPEMSFEAEMIVPGSGVDDLGQKAEATTTFLRYSLTIRWREPARGSVAGPLEIVNERLEHIRHSDARQNLPFPHTAAWRDSIIPRTRRSVPYISTEGEGSAAKVLLHLDGGGTGKPRPVVAENLPRTVLSTTTASESPTAALARLEMRSWRLLQLEPSALRRADSLNAPVRLGADGSHLASALHHLAQSSPESPDFVYGHLAGRVAELVEDLRSVTVERDNRRETLSVRAVTLDGTALPAQALSDGTLRFLALAFIEMDPEMTGVLCLEEPENGIHPARLPHMVDLLEGIACDARQAVNADNPLRQVIINTHSPTLTKLIKPDDFVLAKGRDERVNGGSPGRGVGFYWLSRTWRAQAEPERVAPPGDILPYLTPPKQLRLFDDDSGGRIMDWLESLESTERR